MKNLRNVHLYLGCIFAPMIVFFAVSGLWQTLGAHYQGGKTMLLLSSVHVARGFSMKNGTSYDWSSPALKFFVVLMAAGMVLTTVLGVMMAFKYGKGRAAFWSLFAGVMIPVFLILLWPHR